MAIIRTKNEADYTFKVGSYSADKLKVVHFFGHEAISELFRFSVDLASSDGEINFDEVVGQPALFTIHGPKGQRHIHGVASRFEQTGRAGKLTRYQVEIVPAIWMLSRRYTCRIFQNQTISDIIKQVLTDGGLASDQFKFSLKKSYKPRDYCVQYRESDLSFITRLMEQYGLFYFFEHLSNKHILVMGDDPVVHLPIPDPATVIYHLPDTAGVSDQEHLFEYRLNCEIRPEAVRLRDFDFKKPRLNLEADVQQGNGKLEVYDYPGEYGVLDEGKDLAKVRLEEVRTTRQIGAGQSDCRRLIAGYRFKLDRHDRTNFNREYLITQVSHNGSQPQTLTPEVAPGEGEGPLYQNQFECIPSDVPFRPPRVTPKPVVQGPQTAIVVGPQGEEIYTDEYGRVKVQFHWDREGKQDEKSSCWVRVSQLWAGPGWGAMFIPRIGQEVIVEFLEGDPDQPIITGRVYNGDNKPPYDLPAEKTKSTIKSNSSKGGGGSNEFRFEDAQGSEEIYLHGQKDWTILIENDKNQTVGHDETLEVKNNRTKTVGKDQSESVGDNKSITVGKDHTETIGSNMSLTVGSNKTELVSINSAETVVAAKEITVGGLFQITVGGAMNETVAGAKAEEVGAFKGETVGGNKSEAIGGNRSLKTGGDFNATVGKDYKVKIGKDLTETVGGKHNETVTKEYGINAKKIQLTAEDQLMLKAGSAQIILKKSGDIEIKGKKIQVKGSGDVIIKGSKIVEN